METKTAKFKRLFNEQKYKEALGIIKSFRKGLTSDQSRTLNIAWECLTGNDSFYRQLGISPEKVKNEAYDIMLTYVYKF